MKLFSKVVSPSAVKKSKLYTERTTTGKRGGPSGDRARFPNPVANVNEQLPSRPPSIRPLDELLPGPQPAVAAAGMHHI